MRLGLSRNYFLGYSTGQRADIIYKYSVEETFYRSISEISKVFLEHGLEPSFQAGMHAYVESRLSRGVPAFLHIERMIALLKIVMFTASKKQQ
jgi:hypothetical protein